MCFEAVLKQVKKPRSDAPTAVLNSLSQVRVKHTLAVIIKQSTFLTGSTSSTDGIFSPEFLPSPAHI